IYFSVVCEKPRHGETFRVIRELRPSVCWNVVRVICGYYRTFNRVRVSAPYVKCIAGNSRTVGSHRNGTWRSVSKCKCVYVKNQKLVTGACIVDSAAKATENINFAAV